MNEIVPPTGRVYSRPVFTVNTSNVVLVNDETPITIEPHYGNLFNENDNDPKAAFTEAYINYTKEIVYVSRRDGQIIPILPQDSHSYANQFVVISEQKTNIALRTYISALLSGLEKRNNSIKRAMKFYEECRTRTHYRNQTDTSTTKYTFHLDTMFGQSRSVYLDRFDILLTRHTDPHLVPQHPAQTRVDSAFLKTIEYDSKHSKALNYQLVLDNANSEKRYMRMHDMLIELDSKPSNGELPAGLYVFNGNIDTAFKEGNYYFCKPEAFTNRGVYATREEAMNHGDYNTIITEREAKKEDVENKAALARLTDELAKAKLALEQKSINLKAEQESLKVLPIIITALGAILLAIKAFL